MALLPHGPERALEERGLAGAGAGDEVDGEQAGALQARTQPARDLVVLVQDAFADLKNAGFDVGTSVSQIDFQFVAVADVAAGDVALRAAKALHAVQPPFHGAALAINGDGDFGFQ
jgi:hypothetical protein